MGNRVVLRAVRTKDLAVLLPLENGRCSVCGRDLSDAQEVGGFVVRAGLPVPLCRQPECLAHARMSDTRPT